MRKLILLYLFIASYVFSQNDFTGKHEIFVNENGTVKKKIFLNPLINTGSKFVQNVVKENPGYPADNSSSSSIRWSYTEPAAIGDYCLVSGNGKYNVTSWNLNNKRISLYGNLSANPLWDYYTSPLGYLNFISISDTGGVIAAGSYLNIYLFNNTSAVPFFNFDLTQLPDTGVATFLDLTNNGQYLVCSASRNDSSTIFGFNSSSTTPVWKTRLHPTVTTGGGAIQGLKLSGNDSLFIVNTYAEFYVMNTFTGQIIYSGLINPTSPSSGTQAIQGISGDGSVIATINYSGNLRVYQRSGSTYNFLWQNTEPPGQYYNWYTSVDITNDGSYISAGTLNFVTSSSYDGKVKVFKKSGSGVPEWTYAGCGDEVTALSFSRSGNILSASSWGDFNGATDDLYIFKTYLGSIPIFKVNTPGSFFFCNTSKDGRTVTASGKAVHARQFGNGGILYNIDVDTSEIPTSVNPGITGVVTDYMLYQNYPNPFNPNTKISYELQVASYASLKVFDVLGHEVATLVNQKQSPGRYEVEFDASPSARQGGNLPSGIYFYTLRVDGNVIDTKSMLLLK